MSNDYYVASGTPSTGSPGASASMRAEFSAVKAGFDKLPALTGNANKPVKVNSSGTGMEASDALIIVGGSIDAAPIGGTTPSSGAFTTLTSSGATTLNGTTIPGSVTLVSTAATQTLTNKTLTTPVISTISNTGTLTLPTSTDTLVGRATTDTLTNKTLTTPVLSGTASGTVAGRLGYNSGALSYGNGSVQRTVVNTDEAQTLTNKTINIANNTLTGVAPLASPTFTGTPAAPTATAGTNTTQLATTAHVFAERTNTATLTNKTLTSPVVSGGTIDNAVIGGTTPAAATFTQVNGGQLAGMRNKIINGAFRIWQRGVSGISIGGSDTYTADRWVAIAAGANITASRVDYNAGAASGLVIDGAASNTLCDIAQRIEGANTEDLANKQVTLSCEVFRTDTGNVTWEAYYATAVNNFSSKTLISSGTIAATGGAWTFAAVNFTVPTAFAHHGIEIRFKYGALVAAKQAGLRRVQLEVGSVATPFEHRPIGAELALCQRYYEEMVVNVAGNGAANSSFGTQVAFSTRKRSGPSITQIQNDAQFAQTGIATTTSFYISDPSGVFVYRNSNATFAQFSERFAASIEL